MSFNLATREYVRGTSFGLAEIWKEGDQCRPLPKSQELLQHFTRAIESLYRAPLNSILTCLTIAVTLSLIGIFAVLWSKTSAFVSSKQSELKLSVYLKDGLDQSQISKLKDSISANSQIENIQFVSKQEAFRSFRKSLGEKASVLSGLEHDNPLPPSLEVQLLPGAQDSLPGLAATLENDPQVQHVHYQKGTLSWFAEIVSVLKGIGFVFGCLLLLMSSFIIGNTIRLAIYAHQDEIEIMRLVGAGEGFVQLPFVIEGGIQGLLGGLFSVGILYFVFFTLNLVGKNSTVLSLIVPDSSFISPMLTIVLLLLGLIIGTVGSLLALKKFGREAQ